MNKQSNVQKYRNYFALTAPIRPNIVNVTSERFISRAILIHPYIMMDIVMAKEFLKIYFTNILLTW